MKTLTYKPFQFCRYAAHVRVGGAKTLCEPVNPFLIPMGWRPYKFQNRILEVHNG